MKRVYIVLSLMLVMITFVFPVYANDGVVGRFGASVYPMHETDVEMVSEDILITYQEISKATVDCTFTFHNTGEAKTVLMGFPAAQHVWEDMMGSPESLKLRDFSAYRNGIEIEVNEVEGTTLDDEFTEFASWYVFEVHFDANETVVMTHSYNMDLPGDNSGYCVMSYILETGAGWKDTIKHSVITFDISKIEPYGVINIYSNSNARESKNKVAVPLGLLRYEDGKIIYENWDFEPEYNLEVHFSVYALTDYWDIDRRTPRDWESLTFFEEAENQNRDELITAYNNLSYNNKLMETLYLNTKLGMPSVEYPPISVSLNIEENKYALVYVKDTNFNMMSYCDFAIIDKSGVVIKEGEMNFWNNFSEYGTAGYHSSKFIQSTEYQYIITAYDYAGNSSRTIFNSEGIILNQSVSEVATNINVHNPETNEIRTYYGLSIIFFGFGLMILIYNRKTRHEDISNI